MSEPLSTVCEITISYALLVVGQDVDESRPLRLRCARAARELGYTETADEIEESLNG